MAKHNIAKEQHSITQQGHGTVLNSEAKAKLSRAMSGNALATCRLARRRISIATYNKAKAEKGIAQIRRAWQRQGQAQQSYGRVRHLLR